MSPAPATSPTDPTGTPEPDVVSGATVAQLRALARELATGAAEVVRDGTRDRRTLAAKSTATDLVTDVDRRTERWLLAAIGRARPGDAVLGEESGSHDGANGAVRWVIDPVDGTVNFVLGIPSYAVSVAAEVDGTVIAGAVANPVTGEVFHAGRGAGATLVHPDGTEQPLTGPRDVPLGRAVVGTGFGYDPQRRARQAAVVAPLLPRIADLRRIGAASLDLCAVAAGRLDAYFEAGLQPWDYAAGALVAAEAGCVVTGPGGGAPSGRLVTVAGPGLAAQLVAVLTELGADVVVESG